MVANYGAAGMSLYGSSKTAINLLTKAWAAEYGLSPLTLTTLDVCRIFDYGKAAWVDRHYDFRYLVFDLDRWEILEAAMAAYEAVVGRRLSPRRVLLYNAVSACSYLAHRFGVAPEEKCCGRTLVEDLAWTRSATQRMHTALA
jgi:hypothetical protein